MSTEKWIGFIGGKAWEWEQGVRGAFWKRKEQHGSKSVSKRGHDSSRSCKKPGPVCAQSEVWEVARVGTRLATPEFGPHPGVSAGSITGFSFQRRKWSEPPAGLSWVHSATTANNKKDAGALRTSESINTWSSYRQVQRKHFGHLLLAIKTESWCPDITKTLINWEDVFWTSEHVKNHIMFLA